MKDHLGADVWGRITAYAWMNEKFKRDLESDPVKTVQRFCEKFGIAHEDKILFHVATRPGDLTDEQLEDIIKGDEKLYLTPANTC